MSFTPLLQVTSPYGFQGVVFVDIQRYSFAGLMSLDKLLRTTEYPNAQAYYSPANAPDIKFLNRIERDNTSVFFHFSDGGSFFALPFSLLQLPLGPLVAPEGQIITGVTVDVAYNVSAQYGPKPILRVSTSTTGFYGYALQTPQATNGFAGLVADPSQITPTEITGTANISRAGHLWPGGGRLQQITVRRPAPASCQQVGCAVELWSSGSVQPLTLSTHSQVEQLPMQPANTWTYGTRDAGSIISAVYWLSVPNVAYDLMPYHVDTVSGIAPRGDNTLALALGLGLGIPILIFAGAYAVRAYRIRQAAFNQGLADATPGGLGGMPMMPPAAPVKASRRRG